MLPSMKFTALSPDEASSPDNTTGTLSMPTHRMIPAIMTKSPKVEISLLLIVRDLGKCSQILPKTTSKMAMTHREIASTGFFIWISVPAAQKETKDKNGLIKRRSSYHPSIWKVFINQLSGFNIFDGKDFSGSIC